MLKNSLFPQMNIKQMLFQRKTGEFIIFAITPPPSKDYYLCIGNQIFDVHGFKKKNQNNFTVVAFGKVDMNSGTVYNGLLSFVGDHNQFDNAILELNEQKENLTCIDPAKYDELNLPQGGAHLLKLVNDTLSIKNAINSMNEADKEKALAYFPKFELHLNKTVKS